MKVQEKTNFLPVCDVADEDGQAGGDDEDGDGDKIDIVQNLQPLLFKTMQTYLSYFYASVKSLNQIYCVFENPALFLYFSPPVLFLNDSQYFILEYETMSTTKANISSIY